MIIELRISVWHGMSEIDLVVFVRFEIVDESQRVVSVTDSALRILLHEEFLLFLLDVLRFIQRLTFISSIRHLLAARDHVLRIRDAVAAAEPPNAFFLVSSLRPDAHFHSLLI